MLSTEVTAGAHPDQTCTSLPRLMMTIMFVPLEPIKSILRARSTPRHEICSTPLLPPFLPTATPCVHPTKSDALPRVSCPPPSLSCLGCLCATGLAISPPQTLAGMVEAFDTNYIVGVREEPRLTEQQFGNFQNLATIVNSKAERARFGRFYYRCVLCVVS